MCGLPGHGPGDLIDLSFEGDTVSVIFDAGMSRPAAAHRRGGARPGRRAAHPGRDAGPGRHRRRAARAGEGRVGRRRRGRRRHRGGRTRPLAAAPAGAAPGRRRRAGTATALLHRLPRRDHRAHRRPGAGVRSRRPRLPRGVVPPRRGHAGVPRRPDRGRRGAGRAGRGARRRRSCATCPRACSSRRPSTCSSNCGSARPTRGWPTTTRPRTSSRTVPGCGWRCGSPTRPGCARSCWARPGRSRCSRPDWLAEDVRAEAARALGRYAGSGAK